MRARSVRVLSGLRLAAVALLVPLALGLSGCGGQEDPAPPVTTTPMPAPTTLPTTTGAAPAAAAATSRGPAALPQACDLVPVAAVNDATGLRLAGPAPAGGGRRTVCAFDQAASGGTGLSVGVEAAERYTDKAAASRRSVGTAGAPVPGLGEEALFFYSDADLPDGVGGVLVRGGGATIDVTVQGLGSEQQTRDAAVAIAQVALRRL